MSQETKIPASGRIEGIYLAAGHSYFGRHGKDAAAFPMVAASEAECIAGKGLFGDRFFEHKSAYKGQVTFFALEVYQRLEETLPRSHGSPEIFRRNIITSGIDLNRLIGKRFRLQGLLFEGMEECRPCYWMNRAWGGRRRKGSHRSWWTEGKNPRNRLVTCWIRFPGPDIMTSGETWCVGNFILRPR